MRRALLVATTFLLADCSGSGFYNYLGDVTTLPGANPTMPHGDSTNYERVRAIATAEPSVMLTKPGDVWPGPPTQMPSLEELQKQQAANINKPMEPLPEIPGFTLTPPTSTAPSPEKSFPSGVVQLPNGQGVVTGGNEHYKTFNAPGAANSIIVPNGNGTSTVISPNGTVTTIPSPK